MFKLPNVFSDYDVLVILGNDYSGKDENKILDLCYDIDLKYDILLDVHIISSKELKRLNNIIEKFLNYSRLEDLQLEEIRIFDLITSVTDLFKESAVARGIKISVFCYQPCFSFKSLRKLLISKSIALLSYNLFI